MEPTEPLPQPVTLLDYLEVVKRRKWIIVLSLLLGGAAGLVANATMQRGYHAESTLLVQAGRPSVTEMDAQNPLVDLITMAQPPPVEAQVQVLQSRAFIDAVLRRCGIPKTHDGLGGPKITVTGNPETNVIEVAVDASDPQVAARVANSMLEEYRRQARLISLEEIQRARRFVEDEARKAGRELDRDEQALLRFQRRHGLTQPSGRQIAGTPVAEGVSESTGEQTSSPKQLGELETRASEVANDLARVQAQIRQLQAAIEREPTENLVPTAKENLRVSILQSQLAGLEVQRSGLVEEYRESSRPVRMIDAQIASLQLQLAHEPEERRVLIHAPNPVRGEMVGRLKGLTTELEGLRAADLQLQGERKNRLQRMYQLAPWELQFAQMNRLRDTAEKQYLMLLSKLQDLRIRENAHTSSARVIAPAVPPLSPLRPRKARNLALCLGIGLLFGFCLVFLQEYLDDRLADPHIVQRLLRLPTLCQIPRVAGDSHPLITALPMDSPIAESYRLLRANIGFAALEAPLRTIMVTSAHHGAGKSTIAVNLAIAMALAGRCVVLVDADFRRSRLQEMLSLPAGPGLADVLLDNQPVEQVLCRAEVPGLLVLATGAAPPNPADLLSTDRMARLIRDLRSMADVVVFDTPPCLPVTDAQVMAAQVDGVLLVAAMGEAKKEEVRHAKQLLDRAYARTLGLILNKMTNMVDMVGPPGPTANSRGPQARGAVTAHAPASGYPPAALPESPAPNPEVRSFQRGHALSYVGLFLFTVATYFRPWELLSALSSFTSTALVIGLLTLIVFFPSQLRLEGTLTARTREVDLLLLVCLAGLLSIPLAISPGVAWNGFSNFLKPAVIFIVMVNAVRSERRLQGLLFVMFAASCVFSVATLADYRSGGFAVERYRPRGIVGGIFANPNDLALFLVTMTPILIGLLLGARGLIRKIPYGVCAALLGAAIVVTYSRGGFLALIAAAAVLAWKLGRRNPIAVALVVILSIAVFTLFVPGNYGSRVASILNPSSDATGSAIQRRDQLYRSILVALAHPLLGVGMHNYPIVGIQELQTHNAYTQVAAEMGIPAAVLYTSFIVVPLLRLRQIERETVGRGAYVRRHYLAVGLQASLVGYMVGSFFASVAYLWGVYYLVGYAVCLRRIYEAGPRPTAAPLASRERRTARNDARGRIRPPGTGPALRAPASARATAADSQ